MNRSAIWALGCFDGQLYIWKQWKLGATSYWWISTEIPIYYLF